jgi:hypothetical protein
VARSIPEDLVEFLESGVSILVGTRDADLRPEAARGFAVVVEPDRRRLRVHLLEKGSERTVANLKANGEVSVAFSRPVDHVSVQAKGKCVEVRPGGEPDRAAVERYRAAYVEGLYVIGMPRGLTKRMRTWPCVAFTVEIEALFSQTPGPSAGRRLGAP